MPNRRNFIKSGLGAAAFTVLYADRARAQVELDESYSYYCPELIEITAPGQVVRPDGTSLCSWSRRPYLDLNFEDSAFYAVPYFQRYRMKKWDMYHMETPDHYLCFLVAWIGYGAFCSAFVYDRKEKQGWEDTQIRRPRPEQAMMRDSTAGLTEYESAKAWVSFMVRGEKRELKVNFPAFAKIGLRAEIKLILPADHESVCAVHLTNPRRAHYDHKINCMTAEGEFKLGEKIYRLSPEDSFGNLDFGRGYFPRKMFWYWATASGRTSDGKLIGFNLGHGNHPRQINENAIFHDGRLHKIGVVRCLVPADPLQPWQVQSEDGRVDLTMIPEKLRISNLNLGAFYARGQGVLGRYQGRLTLDSGEVVPIQDLFGLYEWADQKW